MATQYRNEILKISVGEICQAIGFQGICSTPLEVLSDLLHRYMTEVCRLTHRYTEHFGRTDPNLDDIGLAFHDMGISVAELEEYVNNVECPPFPHKLSSLPVPRASNLNFLKPGAREILSRPIHIHEHLPPMYPEKEEEEVDMKVNTSLDDMLGESSSPLASPQSGNKRSSDSDTSPAKKSKYSMEDEGQPVREIESVMMTTSGFISSAREGKLPEARVPNIPMAAPRSSSPSCASAAGKKKLTVEKLIRQKNSQVGPSKPVVSKPKPIKDKSNSKPNNNKPVKVIKPPKMPKIPKLPKVPPTGPGTNPTPPVSQATPGTPLAPPKLKMPPPKIKVPKPSKSPKSEAKKPSVPKSKESGKENDAKKVKKEKEPGKKTKEPKKEKDSTKKPKESKKEKDNKREKEPKKEKESKKEKENKKEKERERERELIRALAASSAVTVTSIPAPNKSQDTPGQEKAEAKSKLSIFKKINKPKADPKDQDRQGERDNLQSRDSSPDLMIDETPSRMGHRRPPEDFSILDNPVRRLETPLDNLARSPRDFPSYPDDLSPPGTPSAPRTPEIPNLPVRKPPEKRKNKEKAKEKKPRKDRSKSPKCGFSPVQRDHSTSECETPDRPKTPEVGLPLDELGVPPSAPFTLPPFPNVPSFIPPFSRFPFMHPFGGPPQRPGLPPPTLPDLRLSPHFMSRPTKRSLEDEHLSFYDPENLERPLTPRHDRDSSPLPPQGHSSPMRSPSPTQLLETPPRPRTPAHHSPPPMPKMKPEKPEKEKKKEHKKEKKEKDKEKQKEKEKVKKKKDKKDKDKEKEPDKKKKEKLEKKEKKKGKKEKEEVPVPHITMKLPPPVAAAPSPPRSVAPPPVPPQEATPKLVIKPVVKHTEEPPVTKSSAPSSGPRDDQPGSPEIAKFSALITRPPRSQQKKGESPPIVPILKIKEVQHTSTKQKESNKDSSQSQTKNKEPKEVPPLKIKNMTTTLKLPSTPKAAEEKKSAGNKKPREKKEKKEKVSKDSSRPTAVSNPTVASVTNPSGSRVDVAATAQAAPAPQVVHPPPPDPPPKSKKQEQLQQNTGGLLTETVGPIGHFVDDQGNEVWICPTCGKQDDGSPMIGCDTCDDWYHWVCVGIQVPPNEEVNWYCPRCVSQHKQRGAPPEKKKRGRKKK